jgi:hypothetical protein
MDQGLIALRVYLVLDIRQMTSVSLSLNYAFLDPPKPFGLAL